MDRLENVAADVKTRAPVAVIGAGWAGCAAAVALADAGIEVALFDTAAVPGGRARRVERDGLPLDNGQHLLLGAYSETLALVDRVCGADSAKRLVLRRPLAIIPFGEDGADALTLVGRNAPGRLGLLLGLLTARGFSWRERLANLAWFRNLERADFARPSGETVAKMLDALPRRVARLLWEPLCLAALNTPAASACAQTYANVLRAAFAGPAGASDFMLPTTDLSALVPEAAAQYMMARGGALHCGARTRILRTGRDGVTLAVRDRAVPVAAVVLAVGPHQLRDAFAPEALAQNPSIDSALGLIDSLRYEPIATVWLGYATPVHLPAPLVRLDDAPGQWLVDRPDILASASVVPGRPPLGALLSAIVSAGGPHTKLAPEALASAVDAQLRRLQPALPPLAWSQSITEKRATYACTPRRAHPASLDIAPGVVLAGDYTNTEFPATLEAAVRSGNAAARSLAGRRQ